MKFPRPLTDNERLLVRWMIEHGDVESEKYHNQLESASVLSECECGCASIDFQIGDIRPNLNAGMKIISDYSYGPENPFFRAFVFTCDNILAGLEVYSYTDTPAPLPSPEDLRTYDGKKVEATASPDGRQKRGHR